jgi:hypothetical protein
VGIKRNADDADFSADEEGQKNHVLILFIRAEIRVIRVPLHRESI